jgi:cytochrome c551/c552
MKSQPESNSERLSLLFAIGLFCLPLVLGLLILAISQLTPEMFTVEMVPTYSYRPTPNPQENVQAILQIMPYGSKSNGEYLFNVMGCTACHNSGTTQGVGPPLSGISRRIPDSYDSPEEYIVSSILIPDEYIVSGYTNIMPPFYAEQLTAQDLADLIAFLMEQ